MIAPFAGMIRNQVLAVGKIGLALSAHGLGSRDK
jgi:hypothetical protein